jgi:hypothetical protein
MPWIDSNDSLGAFMSAVPKDLGNITQGVQTYGFWETLLYFDSSVYDLWMFMATDGNLGIGLGLIVATAFTKLLFSPVIIYGVSHQIGLYIEATYGNQNETTAA